MLVVYCAAMWLAYATSLQTIREVNADEVPSGVERNIAAENQTLRLFAHILDGYDRKIRPYFGTGRPVNVTVDIYLASFDNIYEAHMEYGVTIFLRQRWRDPRLRHSSDIRLPPTAHYVDRIWLPDLIIANAKEAKFKDVTFLNRVVDIDEDGDVLYISRLGLQLSCSMDFHRFPLDSQGCEIEMESFEYKVNELVYKWDEEMPIEYHKNHLKLPQYKMEGSSVHTCPKILRTGNYSCIGIRLIFSRKIGYYILQTYIPSVLLVVMSWVSFWIEIKGSPARVALGVTTVLTMITTTNGVRQNLPPVSYVKAIDVWFAICLTFVIGALLEFALVHYLVEHKPELNVKDRLHSLKESKSKEGAKQSFRKPTQLCDEHDSRVVDDGCVTLTVEERPSAVCKRATNGRTSTNVDEYAPAAVDKMTEFERGDVIEYQGAFSNHAHFNMETLGDLSEGQMTANGERITDGSPPVVAPRILVVTGRCNSVKRKQLFLSTGKRIDRICRWAFPLVFVVFNFIYWLGYAKEPEKPQFVVN